MFEHENDFQHYLLLTLLGAPFPLCGIRREIPRDIWLADLGWSRLLLNYSKLLSDFRSMLSLPKRDFFSLFSEVYLVVILPHEHVHVKHFGGDGWYGTEDPLYRFRHRDVTCFLECTYLVISFLSAYCLYPDFFWNLTNVFEKTLNSTASIDTKLAIKMALNIFESFGICRSTHKRSSVPRVCD